MHIQSSGDTANLSAETILIAPYFKDDSLDNADAVRAAGGEQLSLLIQQKAIRATLYETVFVPPRPGSPGVVLVGAGSRDTFSPFYLARVMAAGSRLATGMGYRHVAPVFRAALSLEQFAQAATEGAILGAYNAALKKREQQRRDLESITLLVPDGASPPESAATLGQIVGECRIEARDLVNLPPNELTPTALAAHAQLLAERHGMTAEVLDADTMRQLGMGSLLGVAAGSSQPPALAIMSYGSKSAAVKLAFVGKGLTFDSGGLSLKTHEGMETMKGDMGGAAAVVAGMAAIARLGIEGISVTGYIGTTENMPGGNAMRPGDVLTAMNGETIEVLNTDAEGRLVLADVLSYAVSNGATQIVDFATLTGGAVVALGHEATLAVGNDDGWVDLVVKSAGQGLERAWHMPLYQEYRRAMDSEIADIKNTGGRYGSALTAAAFLQDFVGEVPWTHMDVAGTAWQADRKPYAPPGGTGVGVGTIACLAQRLARR